MTEVPVALLKSRSQRTVAWRIQQLELTHAAQWLHAAEGGARTCHRRCLAADFRHRLATLHQARRRGSAVPRILVRVVLHRPSVF